MTFFNGILSCKSFILTQKAVNGLCTMCLPNHFLLMRLRLDRLTGAIQEKKGKVFCGNFFSLSHQNVLADAYLVDVILLENIIFEILYIICLCMSRAYLNLFL